jgi:hypothetical protein
MNAATKLTLLLTDDERMNLQKIALQTPSAGIMTLEEVSTLIGIDGVRGSSCNGGSKGPVDAVRAIGAAGGKNAARILSFCRSVAVSDELLVYDLGINTARMQAGALIKRLLINETYGLHDNCDPMNYLHLIPEHAKSMCACIQCKRVTNAMAIDGGNKWNESFNELGTSGSMISMDTETNQTHMRCAKRSSASLRTAVTFEAEVDRRVVECCEIDNRVTNSFLIDNTISSEIGTISRARRDSKTALEQRATSVACGSELMLIVPIVGKVIRIWNGWYALCSFCGCFVRFHPSNRLGAEICCMRCDYRMLHRKDKPPNAKGAASSSTPKCRFCGKEDSQRTGVKWKVVKAPLDTSGNNANIPPPLRVVFFCPQHYRSWIPSCLKTMPMRVILSHIVFGARPCYGASPEDDTERESAKATAKNKPTKRRKLGKK